MSKNANTIFILVNRNLSPFQIEFPGDTTERKGSLHMHPGSVKAVTEKELAYMKEKHAGTFMVMTVKKVVIKKKTAPVSDPSPALDDSEPKPKKKSK